MIISVFVMPSSEYSLTNNYVADIYIKSGDKSLRQSRVNKQIHAYVKFSAPKMMRGTGLRRNSVINNYCFRAICEIYVASSVAIWLQRSCRFLDGPLLHSHELIMTAIGQ